MAIATGTAIALGVLGSTGTSIYNTHKASKQNDKEREAAIAEAERDRQLMREEAERREKARQETMALYTQQYNDYLAAMKPQWDLAGSVLKSLYSMGGADPGTIPAGTPPPSWLAPSSSTSGSLPPSGTSTTGSSGAPPPTSLLSFAAMAGGGQGAGPTSINMAPARRVSMNPFAAPPSNAMSLMDLIKLASMAKTPMMGNVPAIGSLVNLPAKAV